MVREKAGVASPPVNTWYEDIPRYFTDFPAVKDSPCRRTLVKDGRVDWLARSRGSRNTTLFLVKLSRQASKL